MNKKFKPNIEAAKLVNSDLVQIIHMEDYFPADGDAPWAGKPHAWKKFQKDNTHEDEHFDLDLWYQASGDGQENQVLVTYHQGQIKVVIP